MNSVNVIDCVLDTGEMTLQTEHGNKLTVDYNQIERLEYKTKTVKKWVVMTTDIHVVHVFVKGKEQSFVMRSDRFKAPFDSTTKHLRKFAEKNDIVIIS